MRLVLASAVCVALLFGGAAFAQDKKGKIPERTQKVLVDNDRVRVTETVYPPGGGTNVAGAPAYRITRALKGGTLERTYADGRKETAAFKTGEVKEQPAAKAPYTLKNTGKSDVVLYTVQMKPAKK
jgi:mannose-6-phosphate isomerase-like protein (cupin superfamily)